MNTLFFVGIFSLVSILSGTHAEAKSFSLDEETARMRFRYEPVEGEAATLCTHERIRDLPDWSIVCETGYGKKTFSAHVIVREHQRSGETALEILYWVIEPGATPTSTHIFHSTTALMHLRGTTTLADFSLSQGVENDFASLVLGWDSSRTSAAKK